MDNYEKDGIAETHTETQEINYRLGSCVVVCLMLI